MVAAKVVSGRDLSDAVRALLATPEVEVVGVCKMDTTLVERTFTDSES